MEMLNDGILSIDETEGEEISLTAELPSDQFTDEEKLQIESEKEDGDDEVKRIDLFATSEENPLNDLLLGEDGVTTLFMKKGGRVPLKDGTDKPAMQGGGPNYLGKQPEVKVPRYWKSSPDHPDTELAYITEPEKKVLIALNMHGGLEDGKPNTGPKGVISLQGDLGGYDAGGRNDASDTGPGGGASDTGSGYTGDSISNDDQGSDQGHSRFDVGSGYYGEPVTDKGGSGDTITNNPEVFYDDEIGRKTPIERIKTNVVDRREKYNKAKNIHAIKQVKNVVTGNIIGTVYNQYKFQKDIVDPYVNDLKKDIEKYKELGIPEYSPHTDTLIQELEQEILDITQPKSKDDDKKDDDSTPAIQEIMVAKETIEDRDETDIFNIWDKIKAKQAQRSMLVEKGIIQDNTQDQTMMLNSGGLANLFRVKTQ